jgi:hypothetical protein
MKAAPRPRTDRDPGLTSDPTELQVSNLAVAGMPDDAMVNFNPDTAEYRFPTFSSSTIITELADVTGFGLPPPLVLALTLMVMTERERLQSPVTRAPAPPAPTGDAPNDNNAAVPAAAHKRDPNIIPLSPPSGGASVFVWVLC